MVFGIQRLMNGADISFGNAAFSLAAMGIASMYELSHSLAGNS
ncbi:hypothetical protein ACNKHL_06240 [Shigella flexneri]